jgi:Icc-related predicted phosphoesterase
MKALCISDIHAKEGFLVALENLLNDKKFNLVLMLGDIVNNGKEINYFEKYLQIIEDADLPMFWVPGNNDIGDVYERMNRSKYSVENKKVEFGGESFIGMGGVPDLWGHNIFMPEVKPQEMKNATFLSHIPPKKFVNLKKFDHQEIQKGVDLENAPKIQISGHQHSYWGVGYIGKTKILKLPAGLNMMVAVLDTQSLKVEFIHLENYFKNKIVLR